MLLENHSTLYCTTMNKKKLNKLTLTPYMVEQTYLLCYRLPLRICSNRSSKLVNVSQIFPPWASVLSCSRAGLDQGSWEGHKLQGGTHVQVKKRKREPTLSGGAENPLGHHPHVQKVSLLTCPDLDPILNPPKAVKMESDELMLRT